MVVVGVVVLFLLLFLDEIDFTHTHTKVTKKDDGDDEETPKLRAIGKYTGKEKHHFF